VLSRKTKALFFIVAGPLLKLNGCVYRHFRAPRTGRLKVHLGPGQENYIKGWVNVDANMFTGRCDVWADLRNALPFHSGTVDAVYSHHVVEHIPNIEFHFNEVFRCLKPGGVYRVGGPNGDAAIAKFVEGDKQWFIDLPENRTSIGGRFENFIFCRQEHVTILTFSFIEELMMSAGFRNLRLCQPVKDTNYREFFSECLSREHEVDCAVPHTLIVEGVKPGHNG
jgi:predicted SAM-dependent methyltransferase